MKLSVGNFNSSDVGCWIVSQPLNCADNPDVECIRGANAHIYRWVFADMPSIISLVGMVYIMIMISWTVITQERRNDRYRLQFEQTRDSNRNTRHAFFRHLRGFVVLIHDVTKAELPDDKLDETHSSCEASDKDIP